MTTLAATNYLKLFLTNSNKYFSSYVAVIVEVRRWIAVACLLLLLPLLLAIMM